VAILADVIGIEALGQDEVELKGAALPGAADRVAQMEFQLRPIEGAFARQPLDALILEVGLGGRLDAVNVVGPLNDNTEG